MKIRELFDDDSAVSPVIGVILMVAITVILAAVIATFVLGLGDQVSNTAPQASFDFDYDASTEPMGKGWGNNLTNSGSSDDTAGNLTITHTGGAAIAEDLLEATDDEGDGPIDLYGTNSNSDVTAGTSDDVVIDEDDTVSVVWQTREGTNSATLGRYEGPDA